MAKSTSRNNSKSFSELQKESQRKLEHLPDQVRASLNIRSGLDNVAESNLGVGSYLEELADGVQDLVALLEKRVPSSKK